MRWAGGGVQRQLALPQAQAQAQTQVTDYAPSQTPTPAPSRADRDRDRESTFTLGDLVLDASEARNLQAVSEWARPGKPRLAKILVDEVESAKGRVAVACTFLSLSLFFLRCPVSSLHY